MSPRLTDAGCAVRRPPGQTAREGRSNRAELRSRAASWPCGAGYLTDVWWDLHAHRMRCIAADGAHGSGRRLHGYRLAGSLEREPLGSLNRSRRMALWEGSGGFQLFRWRLRNRKSKGPAQPQRRTGEHPLDVENHVGNLVARLQLDRVDAEVHYLDRVQVA